VLAKQVLSQLSYTPTVGTTYILKHFRKFQNPFLRFSSISGNERTFTVTKPYVIEASGLTSSEKQIPRNCWKH